VVAEERTECEWRVTWHRRDWSRKWPERRLFTRRQDVGGFLEKLRGDERPDLSPLVVLEVEQREVGPWEPSR
jgi:hypothetical protein